MNEKKVSAGQVAALLSLLAIAIAAGVIAQSALNKARHAERQCQQLFDLVQTNWTVLHELTEVLVPALMTSTNYVVEFKRILTQQAADLDELRHVVHGALKDMIALDQMNDSRLKPIEFRLWSNGVPRMAIANRPIGQPIQLRDGVPLAIYNQIATAAESNWPGKHSMQVWEINHEIEAWKKLHAQ